MKSATAFSFSLLVLTRVVCAAEPNSGDEAWPILTPAAAPQPRIHGPDVFGVRPGSAFVYTIAATGNRPLFFDASDLPDGLSLDSASGRISGQLARRGEFTVVLKARNALGETRRSLRIVVGDEIALTPVMGWNSWNCWGEDVDQEKVGRAARALVRTGLNQHGWKYVAIDDSWQGRRGGKFNAIQPDTARFPDLPGLVDEIHGLGLKAGIYSTPWETSYAARVGGSAANPQGRWLPPAARGPYRQKIEPYAIGAYSFAAADARQFAFWGFDLLKYDWGPVELPETIAMAQALRAGGRDVVLSISNNSSGNILAEAAELSQHANSWRTTTDITDSWESVGRNGFSADAWSPYSRPGHFNDADMLVVGVIGLGGHPHPTRLTADEQYAHVGLWCLLASPLLLGCDLDRLDPFTRGLLTNDEVIAVDQDLLGQQAREVRRVGTIRIFAKQLADGSWAVGFFNLGETAASADLAWTVLGQLGPQRVRDLWRERDLGTFASRFGPQVAPHGVVLVRVKPITD